MKHTSQTRVSLLLQLRQDDGVAWEAFVHQYGPLIYNWCRFWKLQEVDAEDVTQALLLKLFQLMKDFEYEPEKGSFRAWLKTVTHNAVRDHFRRRRITTSDSQAIWEEMLNTPAAEDFAQRMERLFDLELLNEAQRRVQARVAAHTWRAFELSQADEMSTREIGEQCGLSIAMVYVAKSKVVRMLKEELERVEAECLKPFDG